MRKSIIRNSILVASSGLVAAMFANCSPFSPDLGNTPYLCSAADQTCPDDYACMDDGAGRMVCVASGGTAPDAGSGSSGFQCADDGTLEPNDMIAGAFQTDVGAGAPMRAYGPLAICPETDQDYFAITITSPNQGIEAITRWDRGSSISVAILNAAGTPIAPGTAMGVTAQRACAANLPVATYFVRALSPTSTQNNYRVEMKLVANCQ